MLQFPIESRPIKRSLIYPSNMVSFFHRFFRGFPGRVARRLPAGLPVPAPAAGSSCATPGPGPRPCCGGAIGRCLGVPRPPECGPGRWNRATNGGGLGESWRSPRQIPWKFPHLGHLFDDFSGDVGISMNFPMGIEAGRLSEDKTESPLDFTRFRVKSKRSFNGRRNMGDPTTSDCNDTKYYDPFATQKDRHVKSCEKII